MSQANWWGLGLIGGRVILRLSGMDWPRDVAHGGGEGIGQGGTLLRQGTADREGWHGHMTAYAIN